MFPIPKLPSGVPKTTVTHNIKTGSYNSETGLYEKEDNGTATFEAIVLPVTGKDIRYSDGAYTVDDKKVYVDDYDALKDNDKVTIGDYVYTVHEALSYDELVQTGFKRFIAHRFSLNEVGA